MTIPPKVLEMAVQGGWKIPRTFYSESRQKEAMLNPIFWQALSKICGWSNYAVCNIHGQPCTLNCAQAFPFERIYQAHRLYDLILTDSDTEKFWEEILAAKK